ncbi:MAG: aminotransferase class V-fold PLP-dependent enzyme [Candidatus Babeliales bacterium]
MNNRLSLKNDFPLLRDNPSLVYLDSAATSQKPVVVIDAIRNFYQHQNGPVHRGTYQLAEHATVLYETARQTVAAYIGARTHEIVFTSNATDAINMVAASWAEYHIKEGDEVLISPLEHHANFLVWQRLCIRKRAELRLLPIDNDGSLAYEQFAPYFTERTKLVAILDVSHALGISVDVERVMQYARAVNARVLIDACQSVPHKTWHMAAHKPDFLVFSGHKMGGPTGIGVLYCAEHMHEQLEPYKVGGGMVFSASITQSSWRPMPHLLEAGSPSVAQAVGLAQAVAYLQTIDSLQLHAHYRILMKKLIDGLRAMPKIRLLGPVQQLYDAHLLSFVHADMHFHDVGAFLDSRGICVRTGNYCAQPLATRLGIDGSVRVSLYVYSAETDIEQLLIALDQIQSF